ncbi:expressed unknown protein [Seminavis robusta]|uniref:Ubiquitin-like domain-containing protein n=1 Tax=Seminavis robusta TaxID=568900 RepID=A0A9N8F235_9STRA|nr:expressed unknown protein [Seminavis robusta]|eukprot:Sro2424_g327260.1 n/a (562) ;mRNA; r:12576-14370
MMASPTNEVTTPGRIKVSILRQSSSKQIQEEPGLSANPRSDDVEIVVPETSGLTVRDLLQQARSKICGRTGTRTKKKKKSLVLWLAKPREVLVERQSLLLPKTPKKEPTEGTFVVPQQDGTSSASSTIGSTLQNGDTILIDLVRNSNNRTTVNNLRLYKVVTPHESKLQRTCTQKDVLSYKLHAYHISTGVKLVTKPAIDYVDVTMGQRRIRFVLPTKDYRNDDATMASMASTIKFVSDRGGVETFELFSDTLQDLHDGILQAFGIFAFLASKYRMSLWSPTEGNHWHEDDEGWEREQQVRIPELGLSGPSLEGRFEELSVVMVKTTIAGKTIALRVRLSDTVTMIKCKMEDIIGLLPDQQRLLYRDTPMVDNLSLLQHGVTPRSTLKLFLCLPNDVAPMVLPDTITSSMHDVETRLSLNLVLPSGHQEMVLINTSSSLSRLRALVMAITRTHDNNNDDDAKKVKTAPVFRRSIASTDDNVRPSAVASTVAQMKQEESDVRVERTIQKALGSLASMDRKMKVVDRHPARSLDKSKNNENEPNASSSVIDGSLDDNFTKGEI